MARILVIDNYDSFVYTLVSYVRELGAETTVIRNDDLTAPEVAGTLAEYDGVLISPGPGAPADAGVCPQVIAHCADIGLPVLGVCLGHQAMGEVFGATVSHSPVLMHGKTSQITHTGTGLFAGCPSPLTVTRYHSLAIVDETLPADVFAVTAQTADGVIMGIEHRSAPVFGVQFHPESVLTECGYQMIGNFLAACGMPEAAEAARYRAPLLSARS
ncbi:MULTISPECIES: anthranilate synthase component II [Brevibacterium]|uniref:Aminodeoxychorismate/anthranilate synthase component II n=1 Tax=Brevibacterium luteolum TaxID=199591 RepID=A0A849APR7_9MICO|nr:MULTISPECIES: aminodeoxychorismate/anthranilate synthase component II [Brevibacterium]MBM7530059.1 para-aminobenzoate synthetase component 2 [Brevibacterium luteolum]NNG78809.1 aminodeoxychorismate/anthranilate synthase component II [Brevibacterium luteolum]